MPQPVQHQQVRSHRHPRSTSAQQSSLERHRRKCSICNHPDREEIEERFTHWRNLGSIVEDFNLDDIRVIYRHAHATGLYDVRRRNYLFTIENILECGEDIELTASAYIKAVRAYACLCDTVRWTEPATRVQHDYHIHTDSSAAAPPHPVSDPLSSPHSATDSFTVPSFSQAPAAFDNPATKPEPSPNRKIRAANRQTGDSPPASLLPQAALGQPAPVSSVPSAFSEARLAEQVKSIVVPSSSLPGAEVDVPARGAPPRAEATSADDTPCGSGLQPRHNALPAHPSTRERTEDRGLSSTPLLATDSCGSASRAGKDSASSSSLLPPAAVDNPARSAVSTARATDHDSRVTGHSPLPSNRQIPELESPVTPTKQTPEAISNRHKIAK